MRRMRGAMAMLVAIVGACGGDDETAADATPAIDGQSGGGTAVAVELRVPQDATEAMQHGLDVDEVAGDGVDNQLGLALAALGARAPGLALQETTTRAIDRGALSWLLQLRADDLVNASGVRLSGFRGTSPMPPPCADANDPVCRRHLAGTGTFQLDPATPPDRRIVGRILARRFLGGPGQLEVPLLFASTTPVWLPLEAARARLDIAGDHVVMTGAIGGAVRQADLEAQVVPALADVIRAGFAADCAEPAPPSCGCAPGSRGASLRDLFDQVPSGDCAITTDEVRAVFAELLVADVDLDRDGTNDAVSVGLGVSTVPATY